ncbi:hypothetical protein ABJZ21_22870, partial [Vibrio parahaemolyticus]
KSLNFRRFGFSSELRNKAFVTVTTVDLMLYKNFVGVDNGHTEMVDLQSLKASASYSRVRLNQQN